MAEVERWWFRRLFAAQPGLGDLFITDEYPDGDFDLAEASGAEADLATFAAECELARAVPPPGGRWTRRSRIRAGASPSTCAGSMRT